MVYIDLKTRKCPFCAEPINPQAVKCRFCGEFLDTPKAKTLEKKANGIEEEEVLFAGSPSMILAGWSILKFLVICAVAYGVSKIPLEYLCKELIGQDEGAAICVMLEKYRLGLVLVLFIGAGLLLLYRILSIRYTSYIVTSDRVEFSRGLLSRKTDNIDLFRVTDVRLHRSFADRLMGLGTVTIVTTDKTEPTLEFKKVRKSRKLYEAIRGASLDEDRNRQVVHLE